MSKFLFDKENKLLLTINASTSVNPSVSVPPQNDFKGNYLNDNLFVNEFNFYKNNINQYNPGENGIYNIDISQNDFSNFDSKLSNKSDSQISFRMDIIINEEFSSQNSKE